VLNTTPQVLLRWHSGTFLFKFRKTSFESLEARGEAQLNQLRNRCNSLLFRATGGCFTSFVVWAHSSAS
jgi:hypothetical protein